MTKRRSCPPSTDVGADDDDDVIVMSINEDSERQTNTSKNPQQKQYHDDVANDDDQDNNNHNSNNDGIMNNVPIMQRANATLDEIDSNHHFLQSVAAVAGNVLEWYDFAVFGFFGDIIGDVFFPQQAGNMQTVESFAVFGGAFMMRPVGGVLMGYIGDVHGRKKALVISIFLMAFPTFAMGCLPSYERAGPIAIVLLVITRLLQGVSVGGQLMSSVVYTLENNDPASWGLYGSFVLGAANFGTLLGNLMAFVLTASLTDQQLHAWGWRVPFWSGILVALSGFYLKSAGGHDDAPYSRGQARETTCATVPETTPEPTESDNGNGNVDDEDNVHSSNVGVVSEERTKKINPLRVAFSRGNRRALAAATMVPMLWSAGFYLSFVWMATYMEHLVEPPVPHSFLVNATALLLSVCMFFPLAGTLSDRYGRKKIMMVGGFSLGILSPVLLLLIGLGNSWLALCAQLILGIALSLWGAPMCAWLVESFEPQARLTCVAIGYNVAHATVGGMSPALATLLVDKVSVEAPGWILTGLAVISVSGLWFVAPPAPAPIAAMNAPAVASGPPRQPGERLRAAPFSALTTVDTADDFEMVERTNDMGIGNDDDDDDHELI